MPSESVEIPIDNTNADSAPPFRHGSARGPFVSVGVVALDGPKTRATVPSAHRVQSEISMNRSSSEGPALRRRTTHLLFKIATPTVDLWVDIGAT